MEKSKIYEAITNEAAELSCLISQLKALNKTISISVQPTAARTTN